MAEPFEALPEKTEITILQELNLGKHTLFIMQDRSIDIVDFESSAAYLADNGIRLDGHETYRLFISLHELFKNPISTTPNQRLW